MRFKSNLVNISNPFTRGTMWKRETFGSFLVGWLIHWGTLVDGVIGIVTFRIVLTSFGLSLALLHCRVRTPTEEEYQRRKNGTKLGS